MMQPSPHRLRIRDRRHALLALAAGVCILALHACSPGSGDTPGAIGQAGYLTPISGLPTANLTAGERLRVMATTSIVGDVVAQVGGEDIQLTTLLPLSADPHGYVATPRELAAISSAHLLLVSGFNLEEGLGGVLEQVSVEIPVVSISERVSGRPMAEGAWQLEAEGSGEPGMGAAEVVQEGVDPHVWFDPTIVMQWARNAAAALSARDPANRQVYQSRADAYVLALQALDDQIADQVATIPPERRVIVTDHFVFGYFARRYGFEVVGAVIPAYSASASASPQDLAALLEAIQEHAVGAVFIGTSASPGAAEALARDADIRVVRLYTGSLSEAGGPAANYIAMMEFNVGAIVAALK